MIYFYKTNNTVKIGVTTKLNNRVSSINTCNPYSKDSEIILVLEGDREKEKEFHKKFKQYRINGEWFLLSDEIINFISNNKHNDINPIKKKNYTGLRKLRSDKKLTLNEISLILNISPQGVKDIERRFENGTISLNCLSKILDIFGYEYTITKKK